MNYLKRIFTMFIIFIFFFNIAGCKLKKEASKEKQLNIYIDVKDKESLDVLKFAVEEYKKDNPKVKVTMNNTIGNKIEEDLGKENEVDFVFTSRNSMLKLARKGLLSDMDNIYDENKLNEKYYTVVNSYGRFIDKYYGLPLIPYTMEFLYNKKSLEKFNIKTPSNISDLKDTLKKLNDMSIRIPVVLTDNIDIKSSLASIIINNKVSMRKLENKYDSGKVSYKEVSEMQSALDDIENIIKSGSINRSTFEIGNESTVNKFTNGDIPLIVASSYYSDIFKTEGGFIVSESSGKSQNKLNIPVICNCIICTPVSAKNNEEIGNFIKFIIKDDFQKKLLGRGLVTGNKKVNEGIKETNKKVVAKHLAESTEDSVIYLYNLPENIKNGIASKIDQMVEGKYNKNEWNEILDEVYK